MLSLLALQEGSGIWVATETTLDITNSCVRNNINTTDFACQQPNVTIIGYLDNPCNASCVYCHMCPGDPVATSTSTTTTTTSTTGTVVIQTENTGAIVGGVVGGLGFLVVAAILGVFLLRRKDKKKSVVLENSGNNQQADIPLVPKSKIKGVEVKQRLGGGNYGDVYYGVWGVIILFDFR